jgi:hypothetical protein
MFHQFKKTVIYTKKEMMWPLRCIFFIAFIYFSFEVYEILNTGVAEYRHSDDGIRGENNFGYWIKCIEKIMFCVFFVFLVFNVKEKKSN